MKNTVTVHTFTRGDFEGTLTDEHAAAGNGLPVVVLGGRAYGPADLPDVVLHIIYEYNPATLGENSPHDMALRWREEEGLVDAARRAGWYIHPTSSERRI